MKLCGEVKDSLSYFADRSMMWFYLSHCRCFSVQHGLQVSSQIPVSAERQHYSSAYLFAWHGKQRTSRSGGLKTLWLRSKVLHLTTKPSLFPSNSLCHLSQNSNVYIYMQVYSEPMSTCKASSSGIMQGATMTTSQYPVPGIRHWALFSSKMGWQTKMKRKSKSLQKFLAPFWVWGCCHFLSIMFSKFSGQLCSHICSF